MTGVSTVVYYTQASHPAGQCSHPAIDVMRFPTFLSFLEFLPDVFLSLEFTLSSTACEKVLGGDAKQPETQRPWNSLTCSGCSHMTCKMNK